MADYLNLDQEEIWSLSHEGNNVMYYPDNSSEVCCKDQESGIRSEDLRSNVRKDHEDICPLSQSRPVSAGVKG